MGGEGYLWGDGVEHFGGDWDSGLGEVYEELAGDAETLVDLEGLVNVGVVDEALPADCGAGLLEVRAHDDDEVIFQAVTDGDELVGIFEGGGGVVDRAGTDNDEETVRLAGDDFDRVDTALLDGGFGVGGLGKVLVDGRER